MFVVLRDSLDAFFQMALLIFDIVDRVKCNRAREDSCPAGRRALARGPVGLEPRLARVLMNAVLPGDLVSLGGSPLCGSGGRESSVIKGIWRMPWHREAMKDVARCDKPRGAVSKL